MIGAINVDALSIVNARFNGLRELDLALYRGCPRLRRNSSTKNANSTGAGGHL